MDGAKADLHIHSTASDGLMDPEEIVDAAEKLHLKTIALTDHDTTDGILAARNAAANTNIAILNGVEITAVFDNRDIHLLGYAFQLNNQHLNEYLQDHQKARIKRAKAIIAQLQKQGLELTIDEALAEAKANNICRPHIAAVLVSKGYVATAKEAFIRYLNDEAIKEVKNFYHTLNEVITAIKQAGGVTVIAHPGRLYSQKELQKMIDAGIDGIETVHPAHTFKIQKKLEHIANKNNLLMTGGSDFHSKQKKHYKKFGTLGINEKKVRKVERLAEQRKEMLQHP